MRFEVDGKRVFASSGTGQAGAEAKTVIFIHGGGLDHTVWVLPARYFARHGYRVIAPDLPGHGRSEGPALDTIEAMSDWIDAVAEALNVTQTAVVGPKIHDARIAALCAEHAITELWTADRDFSRFTELRTRNPLAGATPAA